MSTLNQRSNDPTGDASVPLPVVAAGEMAVVGIPESGGADDTFASEEVTLAKTVEYDHVLLPTAGTIRVRYSQIEPLRPRRFQGKDDLP